MHQFCREMSILKEIELNTNRWIIIHQTLSLNNFLKLDKTKSLYRQITNSRRKFQNVSNYHFFRHTFEGGFYRTIITNGKIEIILFLMISAKFLKESILTETKLRMKKIFFGEVKSIDFKDLSSEDRQLLSSKNGFRFYKKILNTYFNYYQNGKI